MRRLSLFAVFAFFIGSDLSRADTNTFEVNWSFRSVRQTNATLVSSNYTGASSRITVPVSVNRGSGLTGNSAATTGTWAFTSPGYNTPGATPMESALLGDSYIEFTLGPRNDQFELRLSFISLFASTSSTPIEVALFSSVGGFTSGNQIGASQYITSQNISLPNQILFINYNDDFFSSTNTYRVYFASTNAVNFALGGGTNLNITNGFAFGGDARTIPEPNVAIYLIAGAAIWGFCAFQSVRKRRRR